MSVALARRLIERQFPELAPARVEPLGAGWDNSAFHVNARLVFRFPRRTIAVELLAAESRLLPALAPALPLAVPVPRFLGRPEEEFPWPFAGYAWLEGQTACRAALSGDARRRAAAPLGAFVAALHAFPVAEARRLGAPDDVHERLSPARRRPQAHAWVEAIAAAGVEVDAAALHRAIEAPLPAAPTLPHALVHGDLYARHVLVDADGRPCGVIDWGDVHVGAPALDLALGHLLLPPDARAEFLAAYGRPVPAEDWALARFRALYSALAVVAYGLDVDDRPLREEGTRALGWLTG